MFAEILITAGAVLALAAVICCMASSKVSRIEETEFPCYGCFWENHCNNKDGLKICVEGPDGWEDAPWEKV